MASLVPQIRDLYALHTKQNGDLSTMVDIMRQYPPDRPLARYVKGLSLVSKLVRFLKVGCRPLVERICDHLPGSSKPPGLLNWIQCKSSLRLPGGSLADQLGAAWGFHVIKPSHPSKADMDSNFPY